MSVVAFCMVALAACGNADAGTPPPVVLPPTVSPIDPGQHACTYVGDFEAQTALGLTELPRQGRSTTANSRTFCTFRPDDTEATELVVTSGGGGAVVFNQEITFAEQDDNAKRATVAGVRNGVIVAGTQKGEPIVVVGTVNGPDWLTISLQVKGLGAETLKQRAIVLLKTAAPRLAS